MSDIYELYKRFEQGELIRHKEGTPLLRWMAEATRTIELLSGEEMVLDYYPHGVMPISVLKDVSDE